MARARSFDGGFAAGATGHTFNAEAREKLEESIAAIAAQVSSPVDAAVFGLTGYGHAPRSDIEDMLVARAETAARTDFPLGRYRACLSQPVCTRRRPPRFRRNRLHCRPSRPGRPAFPIGGRGILIDDAGSGGWIGLAAVRALYRRLDEDGTPGDMQKLADALYAAVGAGDWSDMRAYIYAGDRGRIGALARAVADAAQAGDPYANALLREAGVELARLGNILLKRSGDHPVAFIGGVLKLHPVIAETIRQALSRRGTLSPCSTRQRAPPGWRFPFFLPHYQDLPNELDHRSRLENAMP